MSDETFEQTREYLRDHPELIKEIAYLISNDPFTGKAIANPVFVTEDSIWVVDKTLMNGEFKHTYLVENFDTRERAVLALVKKTVNWKSPEIALAKELSRSPIHGLAEVFDVYRMNTGQKAILFRYYNGGNLNDRLENGDLLPEEKRLIADNIIEAVAEIHTQEIVHRDIKPANILLQVNSDGLVTSAVLTDLGEASRTVNPRGLRHIEHYHSAPEGNALMDQYKEILRKWQKNEEILKRHEKYGEALPENFAEAEKKTNEAIDPLSKQMRLTSTDPAYDSWSLGLILWCLFTNNTYNSFTWKEAVQETDYSAITKLKHDFVSASPWNDIPEPYRGLAKGLLNFDPKKRLTAKQALSLLE